MKKFLIGMGVLLAAACTTPKKQDVMENTTSQPSLNEQIVTLTNTNGLKATITPYGGKVISLWVPDKNGILGDIVLGYDSASQYPSGNPYFGALIGRYGNRIGKGQFTPRWHYVPIRDKQWSECFAWWPRWVS
jgi:aldose 1-epimerase